MIRTGVGGCEDLAREERSDAGGGSLLHLHASVRPLALADDVTRLQAIRSKRWITHHPAARVLTRLGDALEQPPGDRMENLLLLAESGMGKTMVLRKFQRDRAMPFDAVSGVLRLPVVLTLMPEDPTEDAFYVQVLKAIGAPVSRRPGATASARARPHSGCCASSALAC